MLFSAFSFCHHRWLCNKYFRSNAFILHLLEEGELGQKMGKFEGLIASPARPFQSSHSPEFLCSAPKRVARAPWHWEPGHPCPLLQVGTLGTLSGVQKAEPMGHKPRDPPCTPGLSSGLGTQETFRKEACGKNVEQWGSVPDSHHVRVTGEVTE